MTTYLWLIQNALRRCQCDQRNATTKFILLPGVSRAYRVEELSVPGRRDRSDYNDIHIILFLRKITLVETFPLPVQAKIYKCY